MKPAAPKKIPAFLLVFLVLLLLKLGIAFFSTIGWVTPDSFLFIERAEKLGTPEFFTADGTFPLYSLILYPALLLPDGFMTARAFMVINALVSSLLFFPVFLFAKKFVDELEATEIALIACLLPGVLTYGQLIMAENVFIPLFALSIYLTYESFTRKSTKLDIVSGVVAFLAFSTKVLGGAVILLQACLIANEMMGEGAIQTIKKRKGYILLLGLLILFSLFSAPNSAAKAADRAAGLIQGIDVVSLLHVLFNQTVYLMFSSLVIFLPATALFFLERKSKSEQMAAGMVLFLCAVFLVSSAAAVSKLPPIIGGAYGRYIDPLAPLILVIGYAWAKDRTKPSWLVSGATLLFIFFLVILPIPTDLIGQPALALLKSHPAPIVLLASLLFLLLAILSGSRHFKTALIATVLVFSFISVALLSTARDLGSLGPALNVAVANSGPGKPVLINIRPDEQIFSSFRENKHQLVLGIANIYSKGNARDYANQTNGALVSVSPLAFNPVFCSSYFRVYDVSQPARPPTEFPSNETFCFSSGLLWERSDNGGILAQARSKILLWADAGNKTVRLASAAGKQNVSIVSTGFNRTIEVSDAWAEFQIQQKQPGIVEIEILGSGSMQNCFGFECDNASIVLGGAN